LDRNPHRLALPFEQTFHSTVIGVPRGAGVGFATAKYHIPDAMEAIIRPR
jgi:hypothetical protein